MDYNAIVDEITANLDIARRKRSTLTDELEALQSAGIYHPAPRQDWQERESGNYLYLHFGTDRNGQYLGPGGKRKVYVGNKPQKIETHLAMIERGRVWADTRQTIRHLTNHISATSERLDWLSSQLNILKRNSAL